MTYEATSKDQKAMNIEPSIEEEEEEEGNLGEPSMPYDKYYDQT